MSTVLTEELGPRGRQRVRIVTIVTLLVLAGMVVAAVVKLEAAGQFEWAKWEPFTVWINLKYLLGGLALTLRAALVAMVFGIVIGFVFAMARLSKNIVSRGVAVVYIETFRCIPLLLAIFAAFFGLQAAGINIGPFWALVIALIAYNSAVLAEIFRAGINSLDSGQTEAAKAIGMRYWPMMRLVILPQAVRRMIPAIVAQLATLTKDVSLGFVIAYVEVVSRGGGFPEFSRAGNLQANIVVGLLYFIVVWLMSRLARRLEIQQRKKPGAGKMAVGAGLEDLAALEDDVDDEVNVSAKRAISAI